MPINLCAALYVFINDVIIQRGNYILVLSWPTPLSFSSNLINIVVQSLSLNSAVLKYCMVENYEWRYFMLENFVYFCVPKKFMTLVYLKLCCIII